MTRAWMAAACVAAVLGGGARAAEVPVTVVAGHPPVFLWVKTLTETFIPTVNAALAGTGTSFAWTEAYGGTLAKPGGEIEAMETGLAQIGVVSSLFAASLLPLQNVTYVTPFGSPSIELTFGTVDGMHDEVPAMRAAWEKLDLQYLSGGFGLEDYLLMTKFPVRSIADLAGRKIGAPGPAVNWLKGTGAVGVSGNLTTYYNDLQTGVIEGVIVFPTAAAAAKLHEQARFVTVTGFGAQYSGAIVAKKSWYDDLPDAAKAAIGKGIAAYAVAYRSGLEARVKAAFDAFRAGGAEIAELSPEARAEWARALPPIAADWAKDLDGKGLPGSEVLSLYMAKLRAGGYAPPRDWDRN